MAKQSAALFLTLAAQLLLANLSATSPIPSFNGPYGYPYAGLGGYNGYGECGLGACATPCVMNYDTTCNNADKCCHNVAYENCKHVACNVCKDCDTAYCANNDACCQDNKLNCFNVINKKSKRDADGEMEKRCDAPYGWGYGACSPCCGYGYGYPYGCGNCGTCDPCIMSSNTACNSADQCCHNVAYENCEHVACNVCKDCDTAYCANKDACCQDNKLNCFNLINKKVKRGVNGEIEKRCGTAYGLGYPYGACSPCCGYGYSYPYGCGSCGTCDPCVVNSNTACNSADQCCHNVACENCKHVACNVCKDCDTAYCTSKDACCQDNKLNCFNMINKKAKRDADGEMEKRCDAPYGLGYPYGACSPCCGYGYGYPYGCGNCGTCDPCMVSSNTACNSADQCCNNVAYENCKHVACNVCKDCDTAYCTNKDACCQDNKLNCFNLVNKKAKRDADGEIKKRCDTYDWGYPYGCGACNNFGTCAPCGGYGYGYGYPYSYGACGSCNPCVVSSKTACDSADQCCHNVAYENCKHVSCNVCKDCDTAYCANKDACNNDCASHCFTNII